MMMLFDWPEHLVSIGQRSNTTIAPQALAFMNSPQARQYAEGLAKRLAGLPPADAVQRSYQLALGRAAAEHEVRLSMTFLTRQSESYQKAGKATPNHQALIDFCQTLMSMNEFVYVD
jgi:hypothetical protein